VRVLAATPECCIERELTAWTQTSFPPVFKAHRLVYHSALGVRVIEKKREKSAPTRTHVEDDPVTVDASLFALVDRPREGYREGRRCSRVTYPESYIT